MTGTLTIMALFFASFIVPPKHTRVNASIVVPSRKYPPPMLGHDPLGEYHTSSFPGCTLGAVQNRACRTVWSRQGAALLAQFLLKSPDNGDHPCRSRSHCRTIRFRQPLLIMGQATRQTFPVVSNRNADVGNTSGGCPSDRWDKSTKHTGFRPKQKAAVLFAGIRKANLSRRLGFTRSQEKTTGDFVLLWIKALTFHWSWVAVCLFWNLPMVYRTSWSPKYGQNRLLVFSLSFLCS